MFISVMKTASIIMATLLGAIRLFPQAAVVGSGYSAPYPIPVAPGQLVTIFVKGIGAALTSRVSAASLPLPYNLAGISVTIDELMPPQSLQEKVPLLAVAPTRGTSLAGAPEGTVTAVSVQIPYFLRTASFISPLTPPPATLTVYENGAPAVTISIAPMPDQIHIATTCDANIVVSPPGAICRPLIAHADGSLVTPDQPAHPGEEAVLYAFGLGSAPPGVVTGEASPLPAQPIGSPPSLWFEPANPNVLSERQRADPVFTGLTPGFAGLYQINFFAPAPPLPFIPTSCSTFDSPNGNVAITVRGQVSTDTGSFCVAP
jgi:uncharacterized protein (TIGR03437 family)